MNRFILFIILIFSFSSLSFSEDEIQFLLEANKVGKEIQSRINGKSVAGQLIELEAMGAEYPDKSLAKSIINQ